MCCPPQLSCGTAILAVVFTLFKNKISNEIHGLEARATAFNRGGAAYFLLNLAQGFVDS
jgi:hypothetical protein